VTPIQQRWQAASKALKEALTTADEERIKKCREELAAVEAEEIRLGLEVYRDWTLEELREELDERGHGWHPDDGADVLRLNLVWDDTGLQPANVIFEG
jgi:hypothetical protein